MARDQVELVAQAFYAAERSGEWQNEPEATKERFRDYARTAIATLHRQMAQLRTGSPPA
jgi:hypothetical protein